MSDESSRQPGGCACGAIRYAIDRDAVVGQAHCHCTDCQRATGSAFATFCFVPESAFRAERGEAKGWRVPGGSGQGVTRYFCGECGAQLYSEVGVMPGVKFIKAGSLDDASWMKPGTAFWGASKQPWVAMPEDVEELVGNPG